MLDENADGNSNRLLLFLFWEYWERWWTINIPGHLKSSSLSFVSQEIKATHSMYIYLQKKQLNSQLETTYYTHIDCNVGYSTNTK